MAEGSRDLVGRKMLVDIVRDPRREPGLVGAGKTGPLLVRGFQVRSPPLPPLPPPLPRLTHMPTSRSEPLPLLPLPLVLFFVFLFLLLFVVWFSFVCLSSFCCDCFVHCSSFSCCWSSFIFFESPSPCLSSILSFSTSLFSFSPSPFSF